MKNKTKKQAEGIRPIGDIVSDLKGAINSSGLDQNADVASSLSELDEFLQQRERIGKTVFRIRQSLLALFLLALAGIMFMIDRNDALKSRIDALESRESILHSRDSLISILLGVDSAMTFTYRIRDSIPVTYPQLVNERDSIEAECVRLYNEKELYRIKMDLITRNYPIRVKEEGDYLVVHAEKLDSALMLLNSFRDRIHYDVEKGVWLIQR